jgi:hypothetical protein
MIHHALGIIKKPEHMEKYIRKTHHCCFRTPTKAKPIYFPVAN